MQERIGKLSAMIAKAKEMLARAQENEFDMQKLLQLAQLHKARAEDFRKIADGLHRTAAGASKEQYLEACQEAETAPKY